MADFIQVPTDSVGKKVMAKEHDLGGGDIRHAQSMHLADRTDPTVLQTVTTAGEALVTFDNGDPNFDAFGRILTADTNLLSAYKFYDGPKGINGRVQEDTVGAGTTGYNGTLQSWQLSTSAATSDVAKVMTHRHFPYKPGAGVTQYFVMNFSDSGKTGLTRTAGLMNYTETDGICIEVVDTTVNVCIKSSLGNGQTVPQSSWNGDRLDGNGGDFNRSGATLDLTKSNIFWITYQYLSAGAVTIGTFVGGRSVVLHTFENYGVVDRPYMATTDLAPMFKQENTGSVGSTSEMNLFCVAVLNSGYNELIRTPIAVDTVSKTLSDSTLTPVFTLRPSQTYLGDDNRWRYLIEAISAITTTEPIEVSLVLNGSLTGATYANSSLSLEWDTAATAITGGHKFGSFLFTSSANPNAQLNEMFNDMTDGLYRHADNTNSDEWTFCVQRLSGSGTTTAYISAIALEVQ